MNGESLNGLGTFVRAKAGIIAIFFFLAIGWYAALKVTGITGLPQQFKDTQIANTAVHDAIYARMTINEARITVVEDSVANHYGAMLYTICTQIPPLRRDVRRALKINCGPIDYEMEQEIQQSGGFP